MHIAALAISQCRRPNCRLMRRTRDANNTPADPLIAMKLIGVLLPTAQIENCLQILGQLSWSSATNSHQCQICAARYSMPTKFMAIRGSAGVLSVSACNSAVCTERSLVLLCIDHTSRVLFGRISAVLGQV